MLFEMIKILALGLIPAVIFLAVVVICYFIPVVALIISVLVVIFMLGLMVEAEIKWRKQDKDDNDWYA